ncbi:hypothetical protein [Aphanizomenon phage Yong-DA]|nr:hypothetical protein [Aphanizomenon phage Yong-DA]
MGLICFGQVKTLTLSLRILPGKVKLKNDKCQRCSFIQVFLAIFSSPGRFTRAGKA